VLIRILMYFVQSPELVLCILSCQLDDRQPAKYEDVLLHAESYVQSAWQSDHLSQISYRCQLICSRRCGCRVLHLTSSSSSSSIGPSVFRKVTNEKALHDATRWKKTT